MIPNTTDLRPPLVTSDGRSVRFRFLTAEDGPFLIDLFHHLSPESRYQRFHIPVASLSPAELEAQLPPYLAVDRENHVAILALSEGTAGEDAIGVARFKRSLPQSEEAEAAIVVRDDWQRQGVGTALLELLVQAGSNAGVRRLTAWIQGGNRALLRLIAGLGLHTERKAQQGELFLVVHLGEAAPAEESVAGT